MWPLNIRFLPLPKPFQRPTTLARDSSTSCQVTSRPIFCNSDCMYCAICSSSPVGLGMLITSLDMETISSSRTSARMRSTSLESSEYFEFAVALDTLEFSSRFCHPERSEGSAFCGELQIPRFARDDNS